MPERVRTGEAVAERALSREGAAKGSGRNITVCPGLEIASGPGLFCGEIFSYSIGGKRLPREQERVRAIRTRVSVRGVVTPFFPA